MSIESRLTSLNLSQLKIERPIRYITLRYDIIWFNTIVEVHGSSKLIKKTLNALIPQFRHPVESEELLSVQIYEYVAKTKFDNSKSIESVSFYDNNLGDGKTMIVQFKMTDKSTECYRLIITQRGDDHFTMFLHEKIKV